MTCITRRLLMGAGAASVVTVGGIAYWMNGKTKNLPADQRGSLLSRTKEVASTFQQSKEVASTFQQSKKIQDEYTAQHHQDLVSSLSSKQFTVTSDKAKKEINTLRTSYYAGYIFEALQRNQGITPPIFRYDENLPVFLPTLPGETHKGFVFAGSFPEIHDPQARSFILDGDYIRCKSELEIRDPQEKSSWNRNKKVDVLVAGTTDPRKCSQFKNAFLRDLAYRAATSHQLVDPQSPYSDTPVFNCSEKGLEATGDLTDMPEAVKRDIGFGRFTACNFYSLEKTRQSDGSYKEVGAIVAGTTNDEVCQSLYFGHMRKLIDQTKKKQE